LVETANIIRVCPQCGKEARFYALDDVQAWYICENNHKTTSPITRELTADDDKLLVEPKEPQKQDYPDESMFAAAYDYYKNNLVDYKDKRKYIELLKQKTKEKEFNDVFEYLRRIDYPSFDSFREKTDIGEPGAFKPALVAEYIADPRNKLDFLTDINTGILYFFNGKNWVPNAEPYLEFVVNCILREENRQSHYMNILHVLKGFTYKEIRFSQKVACENGLLNVETGEFSDFSKDEMALYYIPVKYDPDATCPNWEAFIKSVVNPDDYAIIQEWSGYILLPDYRFHKLLWVHGDGRNGKGVWQRTLEAILGEKNVSNISLEEFDGNHRFSMRQLYGKLFNPCSEPRTIKNLETTLLKYATGQDTIEAEIKGKQNRLKFRNTAKITVLANKFPRVKDNSTAFRERRLFIKFPNEFTGKNQIQNIEQNWLTLNDERSGILNWMLQGLKRLLEQGYFTESKTQQETEAAFLRASDTIGAFLKEMVVYDKTKVTTRGEAFESYKNYCEVLGLDSENDKKFTQRLKEEKRISPYLVRKPKQERAWKGIELKEITDDGDILEPIQQKSDGQTVLGDKNDTDDTLDTRSHPQTIVSESKKYKGEYTRVSDVSSVSSSNEVDDKTLHFCRLPAGETHVCSSCKGLEAVFRQADVFLCRGCFDGAVRRAVADGCVVVEDQTEDTD
jgi:putative DNA primase/helicase